MKRVCTFFIILIALSCWTSVADAQTVRMPDANLAAVVRDALGLAPGAPITRQAMQRLTSLNAQSSKVREVTGQEGWIENITGLEQATQLTTLFLSNNRIRDIVPLSRLTQLEELTIWNNQIRDIGPLAGLKRLTWLGIFDNPINNFAPLAGLVRLRDLSVSVQRISDLRRHVDLTQLEQLGLRGSGNRIEDLHLLANLTQLMHLDIGYAQVRDLSFLERLMQLESLDLYVNEISDLKPLANLTQLESLDLYWNEISDLKPLANLTQLRWLNLGWNQIRDVTPLASLVNLELLRLRDNPIQDASPLAALTKLRDVDIEIPDPPPGATTEPAATGNVVMPDAKLASAVRKALGLGSNAAISKQKIQGLTRLDARDSQIKNLSGLEHATQLTHLFLYYNQISDVSPLRGLTQLRHLGLDGNQISNVRPLSGLKQLELLHIGVNKINNSGVQLLSNLTELKWLSLHVNQISNITPLAKLAKLEGLWLSGNTIRDVSPLAGLVNLETLHLDGNPIQDTSPLASLTKLRDVDIEISQVGAGAGPKIEGPWLWTIVPTGGSGGRAAAVSGRDWLATASGGAVREQQIATRGAIAGAAVGNKAWTPGKLAPTGGDNITQMVNAIGLGTGDIDNHVAYGSIAFHSPRQQNTQLYVGSDDAVKVWLNGVLVHSNPIDRASSNYQDAFPVTLKQGKNILLVAVYEETVLWSGFFGFEKAAVYSLVITPVVQVGASERPPMYWINVNSGTLHRLVGAEVENLVPNVRNATGLAMDVAGGKLYWTERTGDSTGRIRRANLDGTNVRLVKNLTSVPQGIALDAANGKIYVTNAWGKIQRLNVDGSNFQPNLITDLESPRGLALDVSGGKVYWAETTGRIRRANLDGSNVEDVATGLGTPINIAIFDNTVYWTEKIGENSGEIRFVNLQGNVVTRNSFTQGFPIGIAVDSCGE